MDSGITKHMCPHHSSFEEIILVRKVETVDGHLHKGCGQSTEEKTIQTRIQ